MKRKLSGIGRWLALAVFVLAAGCFYSCSPGGRAVPVSHSGISESLETVQAAESDKGGQMQGTESDRGGQPQMVETASVLPVQSCFVHVCGAVASPGVYELEAGQRVFEAVELAGGFAGEAAMDYLNLAEPVKDGMKIFVPTQEQVQEEGLSGTPGIAGAAGISDTEHGDGKVNLNTASKEELMTLRGIGEARAEEIIRYRQQRGGFDSIEDIMEVSGIKDAAFQKIKDNITV